jgi:TolA-binding protein
VRLGGTAAKEARVRLAAASYAAGASQATEVQYLAADAKAARDAKNDALAQQLDQQAAALSKSSDERLDAAATTYFAAMTESPDLVAEDRIYKWTAARFRSRGKQPEAIALYKVLLERWPKVDYRDRVLCELGSLYTELPQPDWAASLASYQQVLDEYAVIARDTPATPRPMETYAQYGKALALKNTGGLAGAAELLAEVIRNVPDGEALNVRARVELGEICFKQAEALAAANDAAAATKKYLEARNLLLMVDLLFDDPEFTPRALYWTGLCTAALNDVPEAARMWAVLLRNYPASDWAKRAREELKKRGIVVSEKGEIVP